MSPQQTKFKEGDLVTYMDLDGYIKFTCANYIVVCIRQWEDPQALHGVGEVNILVYPHEWANIFSGHTHGKNQKGSISSTQTRHNRGTQSTT